MKNQNEPENKPVERVCKTCAYVRSDGYMEAENYKMHAVCSSYTGPKRNKFIVLEETTCIKHVTQIEAWAGGIVHTSIDCAKSGVERASVEVLILARQLETDGANRVSLIKMIDARLRKLVKPGENNRPAQTATA